ncbi:Oxaloacetate decarboxylase beta chain [Olavius algarvensis spirochete endosymbiont]|uniref:sodium ion-translocating decarboxylase subunit beta n=1 Tax=Olavius algarvensis spirochete endosymbiont TaxID=260710 RepID=UPI00052B9206|nr:sodium ion-translocating decarboxylase subunit beta [Olavius algarvensis spirochete endosymbiont]KGM42643.1 glutaconyl-CoA decarboxylase subunit beta [Alkalispirochaeta odontotermitis]CAD7837923.1 MAG: Oxaloacetate decarboxylase Na(+) pump, beta chain (EC 4.1.1.3) [Olavius algarvensis spirochete endosymbiont]VDA99879.1 Oxaloacetate decarboxylase beta chain [Olavius algarvensis spirochete endosymbiont]
MSFVNSLIDLWHTTGIYGFLQAGGWRNLVMIGVGLLLIWLAIKKGFEPLLLIPIGFGAVLTNIPFAEIASHTVQILASDGTVVTEKFGGFIGQFYDVGIASGLFPLLIFMGVGAMTDFGPLLANPKTLLLGAAAQFGIFIALFGSVLLERISGFSFVEGPGNTTLAKSILHVAGSIGIIGGADGPTAIFTATRLAPKYLGPIAVAAYSYMALVPIIQPPIMKMLTTDAERKIKMEQLRYVTKAEKILFPIIVLFLCILLLPSATPLIGMLMFGNVLKESLVTDRLSDTAQNALMNAVTIMLGLSVGSKMSGDMFLKFTTILILLLGLMAFMVGTMTGVLLAKLMNKLSPKHPINPLIGAAGVSAVPMAARVVNKVGLKSNPNNYLLMHAMGPNVAGVIGSAVAAGILLALVPILGIS